jgi:hypothetical protein
MSSPIAGVPPGGANTLNACLRNYFRSPEDMAREIRALLALDKEQFYFDALRVLRTSDVSPGARYLTALMLDRGLLARALCEPALAEPRVLGIMQVLLEERPESDLTLTKALVEHSHGKQPSGGRNPLLRVLNLLEPLANATRIAPRLLPLLRHKDPQLRSKVVGIIGRGGRNTQWVARQMADPDPRIRANAIEALWGLDDQESRDLLKAAMQDPHNRVVGNALVGLYHAGDCTSITELLKMAHEGTPPFRSTAAWAMGETGDPRFEDALKALTGGNSSPVRIQAAAALKQVEANAAKPQGGVLWRLAALCDPSETAQPEEDPLEEQEWAPLQGNARGAPGSIPVERRLRVAVRCPGGAEPPSIPGTRFRIFDDQEPVLEYSVEPLPVPDKLAMVLLLPADTDDLAHPMVGGAERALQWKRPPDVWAVARYKPFRQWLMTATLIGQTIEIARPEEIPVAVAPPVFAGDPAAIRQALGPAGGTAHGNIWDAIIAGTRAGAAVRSPVAGAHLVVYVPGDAGTPSEHWVERLAALDPTVPIHVIAWQGHAFLEELCRRSQGTFHLVEEDEEAGDVVVRLQIRLLARYCVSYRGAANATGCHIQLRTTEGQGQAEVSLRPEWEGDSVSDWDW